MPGGQAGRRLTLWCGESEREGRSGLAEALVEQARLAGLAGATVVRGIEGFGASGQVHTARFLSAADELPMVVEIVDRADRIDAFLPTVVAMIGSALATVEDVVIVGHGFS
jgi:PII-like signaling protein